MKFNKQLFRVAMCGAALSLMSGAVVAQEYILKQQIIVGWKKQPGTLGLTDSAMAASLDRAGSRHGVSLRAQRFIGTGGQVLQVSRDVTPAQLDDMIATLQKETDIIEYAEVDAVMQPLLTPNDPMFNQQWHYFEAIGGINAPAAWDIATGTGQRVAVIDTGFRPHADLAANLIAGYDFISTAAIGNDGNGRDNNPIDTGDFSPAGACGPGSRASNSSWHGTHVAGTVAARTNNGTGVAGVAFNARVQSVRALGRCGGMTSDIADAILWASGNAVAGVPANATPSKVLNLSLGGTGACGVTTQRAVTMARARGANVVVAAGNSNVNAANATPANCPGVIAVGATNRRGGKASFSNFGVAVDLSGPGGGGPANGDNVLSTLNAGATVPGADRFAFYQGTSMASPHVAGVAALMLSANPRLTPAQVETILRNTARRFPVTPAQQLGTGIVNALAAVNAARAQP